MNIKKRVAKIEKIVKPEDPLKDARGFVMAGLELGLYGEDVDIEQEIKDCAVEGLSIGKILTGISAASVRALPQIPDAKLIEHQDPDADEEKGTVGPN